MTIIELLQKAGANVEYNDPYFPVIEKGRKYNLNLRSTSVDDLQNFDCVLIATDHSTYDYARIVREAKLVVDTRNATRGIRFSNIVRC